MPSSGLDINIVLVFFIYGLAFFSMGLAMMLEAQRAPKLAEARVLWPLAIFGFVHGTHEWLEMGILIGIWFGVEMPAGIPWVRLGMLIISFTSLMLYGLQVLRPQQGRLSSREILISIGLLLLYLVLVVTTSLSHQTTPTHWMEHADALSRYMLAVPGALLAALALNRQAVEARAENRRSLGINLQLASWAFALYSLTQLFVAPIDLFPAQYVNSAAFIELTGMPIQVVRAVLAVLITFGLVRATQVVEAERQQEFLVAQEERMAALEQIQRDLVEREALRKQLLRHTVIAQEDERARIARELHDETAQFLTALTLDLATLRNSISGDEKVEKLLERLQSLSREMSQEIYRMVHDLRPAQLDDLGLVAALKYLAEEEHNRSGLDVTLEVEAPCQRLDPLVETVLFRVAQEALTNVARHAQCERAAVQLQCASQQVTLRVRDEGVGFGVDVDHVPPRGWGLEGMRERAESVNGNFQINSQSGNGTTVEIVVPILESDPRGLEETSNEHDPINAR
jgi:signal transduction histidine kinase